MKRTKQWWAALTKKERSELHYLEYANSPWMNRHQMSSNKCNYCLTPWNKSNICPECRVKLSKLIKKANEAIYAN